LNLTWNCTSDCGTVSVSFPDLTGCYQCNIAVSIRVLGPGDDGPVTQTNIVSSTTVADDVASALQGVIASAPEQSPAPGLQAVTLQAAPLPQAPLHVAALPPSAAWETPTLDSQATTDPTEPGAAADPAVPAPAAAPTESGPVPAASGPVPAASGPTPAPPASASAATAAVAATAALASMPSAGPPADPAVAPLRRAQPELDGLPAADGARAILPPTVIVSTVTLAPPLAAPRPEGSNGSGIDPAFVARVGGSSALFPARAASSSGKAASARAAADEETPSRLAPPPPAQGSLLASGAAGHGSGSSGGALDALLAAFLFITPVLAHWLWVGTERRPRLLRAGRRERPG
jgi:hypothetical protein